MALFASIAPECIHTFDTALVTHSTRPATTEVQHFDEFGAPEVSSDTDSAGSGAP